MARQRQQQRLEPAITRAIHQRQQRRQQQIPFGDDNQIGQPNRRDATKQPLLPYSLFPILSSQSMSRVMLSRTPMLAKVTKSEVPPKEMKGSVMPLVGSRATTTLML